MLGRQLFLPLRQFDILFFFATYQSKKKYFNIQAGPNVLFCFFSQKQRQIIFSKSLPAPSQIMKWSLPKEGRMHVAWNKFKGVKECNGFFCWLLFISFAVIMFSCRTLSILSITFRSCQQGGWTSCPAAVNNRLIQQHTHSCLLW